MSVHFLPCEEGSKELYMIELQGTISGPAFDSLHLGCVSFNDNGSPELTIGTRVLEGKSDKLKLPIVATKSSSEPGEFEILGVVRTRLLFNSRPRIEVGEATSAQFRA